MSKSNVMLGFGKALTGVIIGFFGYIFTFVSFGFTEGIMESGGNPYNYATYTFGLVLFALALITVSFILGLLSIGTFRKNKSSKNGKPIPALVMGIVSVVLFSINAFVLLINVMLIITI